MSERTLAPAKPQRLRPPPAPARRPELCAPELALTETHDANGIRSPSAPIGTSAAASPPAAPVSPPPLPPRRDFADLDPHAPHNIADQDLARAIITRVLLDELAPRIGLDPSRITIRVDAAAEASINAAGAIGLQEGTTILLHPQRYRPGTAFGRHLLAHEAAHAAQRNNSIDRMRVASPDATDAMEAIEREADAVAAAFVTGRPVPVPSLALVHNIVARSTGTDAAVSAPAATDEELGKLVRETHADELSRIRKALSYGVFDWAITDDDVKDVLRILEAQPFQTQIALVRSLGGAYPQRLADNISPVHLKRFRTPILAAYFAIVDLPGGVDALQDDPFSGMDFSGITPEEHYALRKIIPAFRKTAKGQKWYDGLEDRELLGNVEDILNNVPNYDENEQRGKAAEAERERKKQRDEDAKILKGASGDLKTFLDNAHRKLTYHPLDWAITDGEARSLIDDVAQFVNKPQILRAIVESLDDEGLMDRWVDNIPVDDLYTDKPIVGAPEPVSRRKMLLRLLVLRPAWKNSRMAEDLLSYGFFDWAITDEDAFLAFQLVKALPERSRASFFADSKYADRLDAEQSLSMKKGRTSNFYTGGEEGKDLQSLKAQLLEDEVWSKDQMTRLRQLLLMARAADEGPWIFEQSKSRYLQKNSTLPDLYADADFFTRIVQAFELYIPAGFRRPDGGIDKGRTEYVPERVKGKPFGSDNFLASIGRYVSYLASNFHNIHVQVIGDFAVGGTNLDFAEAQGTQGGAIQGVEFARSSDPEGRGTRDNSLEWNVTRGLLDMRASRLDIADINYQLASVKIQTGAAVIRGLRMHMEYPTEQSALNATVLRLAVDRVELDDVMLIASDSMRGFERIRLTDFVIDLSPEAEDAERAELPNGLASGMFALLKQGMLTPTTPLNLTATAGEVLLVGMTTSDGQFISSIRLADIALRSTAAPGAAGYRKWLTDQRADLLQRLSAPYFAGFETKKGLTLQLRSVEHELQSLSDAEAEVARLQPLVDAGQAGAADENRLKRDKAYLAGVETGGVALDVGHAEVRGIAGKVTMGDVTLDDVHGWGHSAGAVLGAVSGSTTLNRMLRGPDYRGTLEGVELEGDPMAFIKLGEIQLGAIDVQGDIPTVKDAQKDLATAQAAVEKNPYDPKLADEVERLRKRSANAETYWDRIAKPSLTEADRIAFNDARRALLADKAFHADSLTAKGAVLELSNRGGTTSVGLDTDEFEARGLEARGLHVDTASGKNLRLGGDLRGGLQTLIGLGRNRDKVGGGAISADELRLTGIQHKYSGMKVDEVLVEGLDAKATIGDASTLDLAAKNIQVTGVNWSLTERVLEMQRQKLLDKPEGSRTKAEKAQLDDISELIEDMQATKDLLTDAVKHLADPKLSDAEKQRYEAQQVDAEAQLAFWQKKVELRKLGIADLNISVTGLGNFLTDDDAIDRALSTAQGITVSGKGPGGQITSGISAEGAWMRLSTGTDTVKAGGAVVTAGGRAGAESIETGPIRGSINVSNDQVHLAGFELDSLELQDFRYFSGNTGIWSRSKTPTRVSKVVIDATMFTPLVDDEKKDGDRYLSKIHIGEFKIAEIAGSGVHYQNFKSGLHVTLGSGRLLGIEAGNVTVDLPKTDKDALLIRGGYATVARAENLRVAASTGSGLALSTTLNTGTLFAEFATDGKVTADLQALSADAGTLTQKDLDAKFNAKADFMHIELMPGSKGYENARQRFRMLGGALSVQGQYGEPLPKSGRGPLPTRFGATLKDIDTGDIERDPDGTIRAPALRLPVITLDELHFDNELYQVDVDKGSPIELSYTTLNVVAEANPTPEGERGKDESAFKRIVIKELHVPIVTFHGLYIAIKNPGKQDTIISLARNSVAWLKDLRVGGADDKSEGFIIEPNDHWQMFGKATIDESHLNGIGADVGSALISNMNADVNNFSIGFFGKDDTTFAFDDATITGLRGNLRAPDEVTYDPRTAMDSSASDTITSRLKRAGFSLTWGTSKIHLHKFSMDKTGARLESLDLAGLRYEDPDRGLTIDINKAAIPGGKDAPGIQFTTDEKTKERKLKIPRAEITDAHFDIADIMKVGGPSGGVDLTPADALTFAPKLDLVDRFSGHVYVTVNPVPRGTLADVGLAIAGPFKLRIDFVDGKVDYKELEDKSTGNIADFFVDLDFMQGRVDWDAHPPHMLPSRLQVNIHVPSKKVHPYWWELDPDEVALVRSGFVMLSTFFKHPIQTEPGDPNEKTKESFLKYFFFGDLDVHLTLPGQAHVDLGNAGFLELGGDAKTPGFVMDMKSGSLPAVSATIPTFEANVAKLELQLDKKGSRLKTGAIHIGGAKDAKLHFATKGVGDVYTDDDGNKTQNELPMPENLEGSLTQCSVDNIELTLPPDEKDKP